MFKYLILFVTPLIFFFIIKNEYALLQTEHYEIRRYLKHNIKKKVLVNVSLVALFIASFFCENYTLYLMIVISFFINFLSTDKCKIKTTKRVKRFFLIYYFFSCFFLLVNRFNLIKKLLFFNNFIIFIFLLSHGLSLIIENIIMSKYVLEAKRKVKDKVVVGITGSYGKTSCKNIIYDMLENIFNVSKTPKSYNTKVGITKSIRENLSEFDEVFICEYGVDRKKGMDKLLNIVKPNISLITEVGPQHILTFKSVENIANEKIKLATVLNQNEVAVINNDNKYLKEMIKKLNCKVITYGIENESHIKAKNLEINREGSKFDLYIDDKKIKRLNIKLLGKHNVLNVLGAIGVLVALRLDLKNIDKLALNVKQVEHRLQLKNIDGYKVIDDSFNSNESGFKMAIDVLSLMKEEKIVVTPGIIEQGKNSDKVNFELGQYMADKIDFIVLVENNYKSIKSGLLSKGFKEENIIDKNNFLEAWEFIKNNVKKTNKIILIENDLPSIYLK